MLIDACPCRHFYSSASDRSGTIVDGVRGVEFDAGSIDAEGTVAFPSLRTARTSGTTMLVDDDDDVNSSVLYEVCMTSSFLDVFIHAVFICYVCRHYYGTF